VIQMVKNMSSVTDLLGCHLLSGKQPTISGRLPLSS
jgi:hypothetical protein